MTLRTAFNSLLPRRLYSPAYQPGTEIIVNRASNKRHNIERFDGDNLYSVWGGTRFNIASVQNGHYSSRSQNSDFVHGNLLDSEPHYELEASGDKGFIENGSGASSALSSKFFVAARLMDTMSRESRLVRRAA